MALSTLIQALAIFLLAAPTAEAHSCPRQSIPPVLDIIPSTPSTGPSTANFISSSTGLDGPQISSLNSTSWDWWYFDAVSPDLKTALTIVFYTALTTGFFFLPPSEPVTIVSFDCTFANGTAFHAVLEASEAVITTLGDGSSAPFEGTGASWAGAPDMSTYRIAIDSPRNGIVGTFELTSVAPPHYPCGAAEAGQNMMVGPRIGWSNAVPDAVGVVDFRVDGSEFSWTGVAYHDKVFFYPHLFVF
jgi:hypothetical protein